MVIKNVLRRDLHVPGDCQTEWSKSEREEQISYINAYMWNLVSVQFSHSVVSDSMWPYEPQHAWPPCPSSTPGVYPNSCPLRSVMSSNHLILCRPLLLLPSVFPSIKVFSNESALCIRWPNYWSFSFYISPSNEYSGLVSFRLNRLDLLAVQETATPQFKSINSSALGLLHSPTLTSIHDHWKNHSLD